MADPSASPPPDSAGPSGPQAFTALLDSAAAGDQQAFARLLESVYSELRAIAQNHMKGERQGHTLQATALVNEVYVRLIGRADVRWEGRGHFFRAAAEAMRKILIDHARSRGAAKRGGGQAALSISGAIDLAADADPAGFLALDDALLRLEKVDEQAAAVVRLRFYAGLNEAAVADALGISERTVAREWAFARAWLRDALEREEL